MRHLPSKLEGKESPRTLSDCRATSAVYQAAVAPVGMAALEGPPKRAVGARMEWVVVTQDLVQRSSYRDTESFPAPAGCGPVCPS